MLSTTGLEVMEGIQKSNRTITKYLYLGELETHSGEKANRGPVTLGAPKFWAKPLKINVMWPSLPLRKGSM